MEREPTPQEDSEIIREIDEELERSEAKQIYLRQLKKIVEGRKSSATTEPN